MSTGLLRISCRKVNLLLSNQIYNLQCSLHMQFYWSIIIITTPYSLYCLWYIEQKKKRNISKLLGF